MSAATAGIVEGFAGAGATETTLLIAAITSMVAGGISLGAAKYAEEAAEADARAVIIDQERRQLELAPDAELAELVALYEAEDEGPGLLSDLMFVGSSRSSRADMSAVRICLGPPEKRNVLQGQASHAVLAAGSRMSAAEVSQN